MQITFTKILETATKEKIKGEEFLSMIRSNEFNPFEDELLMKIVVSTIVMGIVMEFMRYVPSKKKIHKPGMR